MSCDTSKLLPAHWFHWFGRYAHRLLVILVRTHKTISCKRPLLLPSYLKSKCYWIARKNIASPLSSNQCSDHQQQNLRHELPRKTVFPRQEIGQWSITTGSDKTFWIPQKLCVPYWKVLCPKRCTWGYIPSQPQGQWISSWFSSLCSLLRWGFKNFREPELSYLDSRWPLPLPWWWISEVPRAPLSLEAWN